MERSLVLIKPDAVERKLVGKIINMYEENGLNIVKLKMETISRSFAAEHYRDHIGKSFYEPLIDFITKGPLCALVLEGENAIEKIRKINGSTDPAKAEEGTIRRLYGTSTRENCVHASDSVENAKREIELWFRNN
ncbi:nucleoside-diphosphate kinase [Caproiciproducens sp. MSJ-32]|uniref:nucleoside-diphosphate kinase n=1 Tax=Caproiciproducens sp. MSJ-32 TaxID=2841527 RepID=UPI001C101A70|nr:nucleoside-diphosphate kinase [Caproiciproducens sp. MSJ-32]MBU5455111.1 nucleoside-diphosphate kinase [Caproiciproducens sp. MSJ-32]